MRGAKEFEAANDRTPSIFIEREKNQVRWEEEEELYFIANIKVIINNSSVLLQRLGHYTIK